MKTRLNVCDLNAIETRVGAWLAECHSLMSVFEPYTDPTGKFRRNGRDSYIAFGVKIYPQHTYDRLFLAKEGVYGKEEKKLAKQIRQFGKVGVLGSIYRMGGGGWGRGKASYIDHLPDCPHKASKRHVCQCEKIFDKIRTGLWGFAYGQGVDMKQEEAHMVTRVFRDSYPEICNPKHGIWTQLEEAVMAVMDPKHPNTRRAVGPNGCVMIDRLNIDGRKPMMRMQLPSGRRLHYMDAHVIDTKMPWTRTNEKGEQEDVYRPALWYANEDQVTGQWSSTTTHGGKLFENLVQGIARDVLACKLLDFEYNDMPVVGHVHDEGLTLVANDPFSPGIEEMIEIMSTPIGWAPGLLLGADGFEETFYHK